MKIAAVVVWFNPSVGMTLNLKSYSNLVFKTIIIDNSFDNNIKLIEEQGNINNLEYYPLNKNIGVAAAFNLGYKRAVELGAEWVLTMDQDSSFLESHIKNYLDPNAIHFKEVGVAVYGSNFDGKFSNRMLDCNSVISSGSLVSLAAHKINIGYNENLFIDQVDHEYCYRLKLLGFRILKLNYISMSHTVGNPITKKSFGRVFVSYNHNPVRKYYITRNSLYIRHHYRPFAKKYLRTIIMDILNIIFIENNKYNKLKAIIFGFRDYFLGRMGPIHTKFFQ